MPTRLTISLLLASATLFGSIVAVAQDSHQLPADHLSNAHPRFMALPPYGHGNSGEANRNGGIDTLVHFSGSFKAPGYGPEGKARNLWFYKMVGNPPEKGGTTNLNAPIVPVIVQLLNPDGSV